MSMLALEDVDDTVRRVPWNDGSWTLLTSTERLTLQMSMARLGMIMSSGPTVIIRTGPTPDRLRDLRSGR
jgi:hypothetical protein